MFVCYYMISIRNYYGHAGWVQLIMKSFEIKMVSLIIGQLNLDSEWVFWIRFKWFIAAIDRV